MNESDINSKINEIKDKVLELSSNHKFIHAQERRKIVEETKEDTRITNDMVNEFNSEMNNVLIDNIYPLGGAGQ